LSAVSDLCLLCAVCSLLFEFVLCSLQALAILSRLQLFQSANIQEKAMPASRKRKGDKLILVKSDGATRRDLCTPSPTLVDNVNKRPSFVHPPFPALEAIEVGDDEAADDKVVDNDGESMWQLLSAEFRVQLGGDMGLEDFRSLTADECEAFLSLVDDIAKEEDVRKLYFGSFVLPLASSPSPSPPPLAPSSPMASPPLPSVPQLPVQPPLPPVLPSISVPMDSSQDNEEQGQASQRKQKAVPNPEVANFEAMAQTAQDGNDPTDPQPGKKQKMGKAPKGARSAYNCFGIAMRPQLIAEGIPPTQITTRTVELWKEAGLEARAPHNTSAANDKWRHQRQQREYMLTTKYTMEGEELKAAEAQEAKAAKAQANREAKVEAVKVQVAESKAKRKEEKAKKAEEKKRMARGGRQVEAPVHLQRQVR
jgi:hypothetical protein